MRRGQVWIETVIYTLIGLALIGVVLAIMTPKINQFRDQAVIDQTIESLNVLDSKIQEVRAAPGNRRVIDFTLKRGKLIFDPASDKISFIMDDSRVLYSEPGVPVEIGRISVLTEEGPNRNTITLSINYQQDITFDDQNLELSEFTPASVPYRFAIENKGFTDIGISTIDVSEIS